MTRDLTFTWGSLTSDLLCVENVAGQRPHEFPISIVAHTKNRTILVTGDLGFDLEFTETTRYLV